jgi:hypothetical protein
MNRFFTRFALLAGMVVLTGIAASAQDLRGNIPFAFNANGADLPAGTYELVRQNSAVPLWIMRNVESRKQVVLISPMSAQRAYRDRTGAALQFRCAAAGACGLEALYSSGEASGFGFLIHKKANVDMQVATVRTVRFGD